MRRCVLRSTKKKNKKGARKVMVKRDRERRRGERRAFISPQSEPSIFTMIGLVPSLASWSCGQVFTYYCLIFFHYYIRTLLHIHVFVSNNSKFESGTCMCSFIYEGSRMYLRCTDRLGFERFVKE